MLSSILSFWQKIKNGVIHLNLQKIVPKGLSQIISRNIIRIKTLATYNILSILNVPPRQSTYWSVEWISQFFLLVQSNNFRFRSYYTNGELSTHFKIWKEHGFPRNEQNIYYNRYFLARKNFRKVVKKSQNKNIYDNFFNKINSLKKTHPKKFWNKINVILKQLIHVK